MLGVAERIRHEYAERGRGPSLDAFVAGYSVTDYLD